MKTLLLTFCALGGSLLHAGLIYDNTVTDTGNTRQYLIDGFTGIGDKITLGGTDRTVTQATAQFFNGALTSGSFDVTLQLYAAGSGGSVVGNLLGAVTVSNVSISAFDLGNPFTSGTTTVTFNGLNVTVPNDVIFVLLVSNQVNTDIGVTLFDPPAVGSSDNASYVTLVGSTFATTSADPGNGNVNFSLTAVPEPATLVTLGGGLALLAAFARRKRVN